MTLRLVPIFAVILLTAGIVLPSTARADSVYTHAEVVCQKGLNVALVRFTESYDETTASYRRLPVRIDSGLSATRQLRRSNCTMANGWALRVRSGDGQAFAYGMGGADPPAFFSLWIAQRKVVSRQQWKPGYSATDPMLIAVVVRPDRLTYCYVPYDDDMQSKGAITCRDRVLRLGRYNFDRIEYGPPGARPPVGTVQIAKGSTDLAVCRKYLRLRRGKLPEIYSWVDSAKVFPADAPTNDLQLGIATIEIAPGVRRKLINWPGINHYFDGDLMFVAPESADPFSVLKREMLDDSQHFPVEKLPPGWTLISGQQPTLYPGVKWRYVHFDTQRIDGRLYLLGQPANIEERPSAILVRPLAFGFRSVCRFQMVEENF